MPSTRSLRPIILPSARHLPPIPSRLLCCRVIHQHHHRRTTATLRLFTKSQNSLVGSAIAATFGAALWLRPQRSTNAANTVLSDMIYARYGQRAEEHIKPTLFKAFQEYLGCQNIKIVATTFRTALNDDGAEAQVALFLDADAASESLKGSFVGFALTWPGREDKELVDRSREMLNEMDRQGLLRREGQAVCLISCIAFDGIWVYGEAEVEGAVERGRMIPILFMKKDYCLLGWTDSGSSAMALEF